MPCAVFVFAHLELVDAIVDRGRRRRPRVRYVDSVMSQDSQSLEPDDVRSAIRILVILRMNISNSWTAPSAPRVSQSVTANAITVYAPAPRPASPPRFALVVYERGHRWSWRLARVCSRRGGRAGFGLAGFGLAGFGLAGVGLATFLLSGGGYGVLATAAWGLFPFPSLGPGLLLLGQGNHGGSVPARLCVGQGNHDRHCIRLARLLVEGNHRHVGFAGFRLRG